MEQSIIKRTKQAKMAALANRFAVQIAQERNDPMYIKYKLFRDKFISAKKSLGQKYKTVAAMRAKEAVRRKKLEGGDNK